RRVTLDGTPTRHLPWESELAAPTLLAPATWQPYETLMLMPPGARHSLWWSFTSAGAFPGWYVNLETPPVRRAGGGDTHDHALDILIAPDRTWQWKDEDEFAEQTTELRFWDQTEAVAIRAEGERVIQLAESQTFPFDGTWCDFHPDPNWAPITLPWCWDLPPA